MYKTVSSTLANQAMLNQSDLDLPLELVLSVNKSIKEDDFITKNIINFYNLSLNEHHTTQPSHLDLFKTKKIIDYLNFIRFNNLIQNENPSDMSPKSKITVPSYSIILLTNSQNQKLFANQNELKEDKLCNPWAYHHKIELNDENGHTIARQVFFKLNHKCSIKVPLCCRSNWIAPISPLNNQLPKKYITRLNINCKNYDLMLFFYRLLFDKFPNFSKKDFSLFILIQNNHKLNNPETNLHEQISVEFQLSLKYDPSVSVNKIPNSFLIYKISDRSTFENVVRLLEGFVEEIEKNKCYSVLDPDHNRIYLVDTSPSKSSSCFSRLFSTTSLSQNYYKQLNSVVKLSKNLSNFSPNSNTSSCSETSSFDSGKDSGNWSCSPLSVSNNRPSLSSNSIANKSQNNQNNSQNLARKYGNFNNRTVSAMSNRTSNHTQRKTRKKYQQNGYSDEESEDYDEDSDYEDGDWELRNLLKKATNSSMYALNALAYKNKSFKNRPNQRSSMVEVNTTRSRQRSLSALNEPYVCEEMNKSKIKGVLTNRNNSSLSRKKSKSVTFMDSIGAGYANASMNRNFDENQDHHGQRSKSTTPFNSNRDDQFYTDDIDNYFIVADADEACYNPIDQTRLNNDGFYKNSLIDQRNGSFGGIRNQEFLSRLNINNNNVNKPSVGITAENRFRRAHTLDMIRSTKMPLRNTQQYLEQQQQGPYFNCSNRFNLHVAQF